MSSRTADDTRAAPLRPLVGIGELSRRSGLAPSALRFYERRGLIASLRSDGGRRLYQRSTLRRLAVISVAQQVGLSLDQIAASLKTLPRDRTPTRAEWKVISDGWRRQLEDRIAQLERLRDDLTSCIGCGCLSLRRCRLYNRGDESAGEGTGSRLERAYGTRGRLPG